MMLYSYLIFFKRWEWYDIMMYFFNFCYEGIICGCVVWVIVIKGIMYGWICKIWKLREIGIEVGC